MKAVKQTLQQAGELAGSLVSQVQNCYQLAINGLSSPLWVRSVASIESLSQPWRYTMTVDSVDRGITPEHVLSAIPIRMAKSQKSATKVKRG